jgi:uncharacterized protein YcaQ
MIAAGEAVEVRIDRIESPHYALPDMLNVPRKRRSAAATNGAAPRVHILSPFDTFLRRDRMQRLFGYEYRIECYTPAAKRKYGYFTLPILFGDALVGRLDAKADRAARTLIVRHAALEPGFDPGDHGFVPALAERLGAFAAFNGCDRVEVERTTPAGLRAGLARAVTGNGLPVAG